MLKVVLILLISIAPVFSSEEGYSSKLRKSIFGTKESSDDSQYQARRFAALKPMLMESQREQEAKLAQQERIKQQTRLEQIRQLEQQTQLEQIRQQEQRILLDDGVRLLLSQPGMNAASIERVNQLSNNNPDVVIQVARLYKTGLFTAQYLLDLIDNIERIRGSREIIVTNLLDLLNQMPSLSSENRIALINGIIWNGNEPERIVGVTQQALRLIKVRMQYRPLLAIIKDILTKPDKEVIVDYLVKLIDRCPDLLGNRSKNCVELYKSITSVLDIDRTDVMAHVLRLAMPDMLTGDLISLILKIKVTPKERRDELVTRTEDKVIPIIVQQ